MTAKRNASRASGSDEPLHTPEAHPLRCEPVRELMYAILCTRFGIPGFYEGMWYLRRDAIKAHCKAIGKTWKQASADGDCCVRVMVEASR